MSRMYGPDDPNLHIGNKIYLKVRGYSPYFAFAFFGLLLWILSYAVVYFFKDLFIAYLKKDEPFQRGYLYKYLEYKPHLKKMIGFGAVIILFWVIIFFIKEWRLYSFISGFMLALAFYSIFLIKYYFIDNNDFDFFDDLTYIVNRYRLKNDDSTIKKRQ
jgi:hypothetical protein